MLENSESFRKLEALDDIRYAFGLPRARTMSGREYAKLLFGEYLDERMSVVVMCDNLKGHGGKRWPVETKLNPETGLTDAVECPRCHAIVPPRGEPKRVTPRVDSGTKLVVKRL